MAATSRKPEAAKRWYEVVVSFNGLDKGAWFSQDADDAWALQHAQTGYLRDITERFVAEEVPDAGRGEVGQG